MDKAKASDSADKLIEMKKKYEGKTGDKCKSCGKLTLFALASF